MILEEHRFDSDTYEEVKKDERGVVEGYRVKPWQRQREAVEFGARGENSLKGYLTLSGYQASNGDILTYSTEDHSKKLGLTDPEKTHELPFDNVVNGSMVKPWSYREDKSLQDLEEKSCKEVLESIGVEADKPKETVNALLSMPVNSIDDESTDSTSEIYVKGLDLDFDGCVEPLVDDLVEETEVKYIGGKASFYHAETSSADTLEYVHEELGIEKPEITRLTYTD